MNKLKFSTEEFIEKCKESHPDDNYDYSKTKYTGALNDVCIICPIHGEFFQNAHRHMKGANCPQCVHEKDSKNKASNTEEWKRKANEVWNGRYKYDKVKYVNNDTKICITCPIHGDWWQRPSSHLEGYGCPICKHDTIRAKKSVRYGKSFLEKSRATHGDRYDYSLVDYVNEVTPVKIICSIHGIFEQKPCVHLLGCGCPMCKFELSSKRKTLSQDEFLSKAKIIHGDKYDYSESVYSGYNEPIDIICPTHGKFTQKAGIHLRGCGCPICCGSHGEREIAKILDKYGIEYEVQYVVHHLSFLYNRDKFYVDFKIKGKDIFIEYNGQHHYEHVEHFHHKGFTFEDQKNRDLELKEYCISNKIKLIEIPYWDFDNIEKILKKELKIKTK